MKNLLNPGEHCPGIQVLNKSRKINSIKYIKYGTSFTIIKIPYCLSTSIREGKRQKVPSHRP